MTASARCFTLSGVKSTLLSIALLTTLVSAAACRQPDGPLPSAGNDAEIPNKLYDMSRDLQSIAGGEEQAKQDWVDDVRVFARTSQSESAVVPFARQIADAVAGTKLTEQGSQQLAHSTWTAVAATELSDRQVETLQGELKSHLLAAGVPDDRATAAATEVGTVQKAISTRPRRWYEVF